jgi:phage/plasmid-like protein (TIGR03299 family)
MEFMAHLVQTMFSAGRQTPWHGLGNVVDTAPNSEEALKLAGLDWEVQPSDVVVNGLIVPNYKANVRSDNGTVLGIVSDRYTIVQNAEAFQFTDNLIGSGDVRYETAGALRDGRVIWLLASLEKEYEILGDDIAPYMCFTNSHDGTGAVRVMMTPIRVVCNNTLNLALKGAKRQWSTVHKGDIARKIESAEATLMNAEKYMEALNEEANNLVDIKITPATWADMVNELIPSTEKMSKRQLDTVGEKRQALHDAIMMADIQKFKGTGWAAINAVTDFVAHTEPARQTKNYADNNFQKVIQGHSLVDQLHDLLRQVA